MSGRFGLLKADEIECRISQTKANGLSLLLYKTARTDANILDAVVGPENWANDFRSIDGVLFCGVGVRSTSEPIEWIWKWDAGSESRVEKEKGEASDAFKRAGFKHGIGRELYTAPFIWISSSKCTIKDGKCADYFSVSKIEYENERIAELVIRNDTRGAEVFFWEAADRQYPLTGGDDDPWDANARVAKVDTSVMSQAQINAISALVKEVFGGHAKTREVFQRITGYTVQQLAGKAIPAAEYDSIVSKLTLTPEAAQQALEELEK